MRTIDSALKINACPLPINVQTFRPESESLPMNKKNDAQGEKRVFERTDKQALVGELTALSSEACQDGALITIQVIDMNFKVIRR